MKAIKLYRGGIQELRQAAVDPQGRVWVRIQEKSNYGYCWSRWRLHGNAKLDPANLPLTYELGFTTLSGRPDDYGLTADRVRLPNEARS